MAAAEPSTPMMRQYHQLKSAHPGSILFFRLGDFYEMFFEDAELASPILDITLTARHRGTPSEAPMCGVPHHSADGYIVRLLQAGHKVAIAEQVEKAGGSKGMVRREVVRVVTPGTLVEDGLLASHENNFIVAICESNEGVGVSALDVSTGEFVGAEFRGESARQRACDEISRWSPRELCHIEGVDPVAWLEADDPGGPGGDRIRITSPLQAWVFDPERSRTRLCDHFGVTSLEGFDFQDQSFAIGAAGALLHYVAENYRTPLRHVQAIRRYRDRDVLQLDAVTRRSLELTETWQDGTRTGSVLAVLDESITAMGGRRLRQWLLRPLRDSDRIRARHDVVESLAGDVRKRDSLVDELRKVHDLERLTTRVALGSASPRDVAALRRSLEVLPHVRKRMADLGDGGLLGELYAQIDPCGDIAAEIARRLADEPPATVSAGGVIRVGFDAELDRLRDTRARGKEIIADLEASERQRTGIGSLKVGFNKVFGYYIEVSKANLDRVPESFIRKQTLANAERFITADLKEFEETVLGAEEKIAELEETLFMSLRTDIAEEAGRMRRAADAVGSLDALTGLAIAAVRHDYVRPEVDDELVIEIRGGRHLVVEQLQPTGRFVPNDAYLDADGHRIQLVTGPNMGGKSTYLRQIALTVIQAQMGGFVSADAARIGLVDRIFTRVGASDNLARGASTFLVEMQETANILHNASPRSLVLLDEVGRGTSTYDGMAIAWAVVEYLHDNEQVSARTLFATHYLELTALEGELAGVSNLRVAARESGDGVTFLHRVEPGPADRSYGVHVARLAGLPGALVQRAGQILECLESDQAVRERIGPASVQKPITAPPVQFGLFEVPAEHPVVARLRELDPERLTPLQALLLLSQLRAEVLDASETCVQADEDGLRVSDSDEER